MQCLALVHRQYRKPSDDTLEALDYGTTDNGETERREKWGYLAPVFEFDNGVYPQPFIEVTNGVVTDWDHMIETLTESIIRSKYTDLLWVKHYGDKANLLKSG